MDMDLVFLYLAALTLVCLHTSLGSVVSSDPDITCMLDDDDTSEELSRCLNMGSDYVEGYLHSLKPGKIKREFDRCGSFVDFDTCLTSLLETCPSFRTKLHSHWRNLYDTMRCACIDDPICKKTVTCFEEEQRGLLARRCDAMYKFNIQQNTREKCHFLKDSVHCKQALVSTSCGFEAGLFAFHVAKLGAKLGNRKHSCTLTHTKEKYRGFSYSDQCPANFTAHMEQCKQQFFYDTSLEFHELNDMVADGNRKNIRKACKDYCSYRECLGSIEDKCKEGIDTLLSYDGGLRTYLLKMEYICNEAKAGYTSHVSCYRRVLHNHTLARCDYLWESLSPMLQEVTAHQFYCLPDSPDSLKLTDVLVRLRGCYEDVFTESCGSEGGKTIGGLMTKAFQDPFYLRYKYKPDCELHRATKESTHHQHRATQPSEDTHHQATQPSEDTHHQATQPEATTIKPHHRTQKTERSKDLKENEVRKPKPVSQRNSKTSNSGDFVRSSKVFFVLTFITLLCNTDLHRR